MTADLENEFSIQRVNEIQKQGEDVQLNIQSNDWLYESTKLNYSYHFDWMGRPIIQYPQDIIATQEIIWQVKPDLIIETGIAHGGSLIFSASMLALLEYSECLESQTMLDPTMPKRKVLGVDIDVRAHNREAIQKHPMSSRIQMVEGSSVDSNVISQVKEIASQYENILVCLDSNHTHDHVLAELEAYAPLVTINSYCLVFDTVIEDLPSGSFQNRPWDKGDNPKTAVWSYLNSHPELEIDKSISNKLLISVAPDGYLKRVK